MGCGVSKKNIAEPSRLQTVIVNEASPQSHLKAHEATLQQNHGLVCLIGTQYQGPSIDGLDNFSSNNECNNSKLQILTHDLDERLHPLIDCAQDCAQEGYDCMPELQSPWNEEKEDLPQSPATSNEPYDKSPPLLTPITNVPCDKTLQLSPTSSVHCDESLWLNTMTNVPCYETPRAQHKKGDSPLFCTSDGLVGTLASLDEKLGAQEDVSHKLAIKVTTEKIMSYGGVLHSLEDQTGDFTSTLAYDQYDDLIELNHQAKEEKEMLGSSIGNYDRIESPTLTISPMPALENFRKKLPPILSPPSSSLIHELLIVDPFAKTPFPIYCQPRTVEIQNSVEEPPPSSPQLPHTTKLVKVENVKDILVMDGASCNSEKSGSSSSWTPSEGQQCDVHNSSTSQETLELQAQESNLGCYDSNMHPSCHNIIVSSLNLISHFEEKDGLKASSPLFSTSSCWIECLKDSNMKPLSSEEFYS